MGMRVKAVWKPKDEWGTTIENISHFAPTGEPDADYETYKQPVSYTHLTLPTILRV